MERMTVIKRKWLKKDNKALYSGLVIMSTFILWSLFPTAFTMHGAVGFALRLNTRGFWDFSAIILFGNSPKPNRITGHIDSFSNVFSLSVDI